MLRTALSRSMLPIVVVAIACALPAPTAQAQTLGRRISYQGQLTGATGPTTIHFQLYDDTGTPVWGPEIHVVTPDAQGRFVAVVGITDLDVAPADGTPDLDQLAPDGLELEVAVENAAGTMMVPLTPRQHLFAAFHASSATFAETVADGAVGTTQLADGAVDSAKLANDAVTGAHILDGSITGSDIASSSITQTQIANNSLTGADIADNSLTAADLASGSVTSSEIANGSIAGVDIATAQITGTHIQNGSITSADLGVDVAQNIPPSQGGFYTHILVTGGSGCPTYNGQQIYTFIGLYELPKVGGGSGVFGLCRQ